MAITAKQPLIAMKPPLRNAALVVLLMAGTCANAAVDAVKAKELATKNACLGCHAIATRILGPSYKEVAARYEKDKSVDADALAARIRAGGKGKWGAIEMPPQAGLSEADAKILAEWILSDPSK